LRFVEFTLPIVKIGETKHLLGLPVAFHISVLINVTYLILINVTYLILNVIIVNQVTAV